MAETLVINEIYLSLQGESTFAGLPCIFVRLTACNLRCSYCDTAYAFTTGHKMTLPEIRAEVNRLSQTSAQPKEPAEKPEVIFARALGSASDLIRLPLIEFTGGEPLLQPNTIPLMKSFCEEQFTVLIETSGAHDISPIDPRVHRIMDLKCPSSGEVTRNRWENLAYLRATDEIKFVIGTVEDYEWAKEVLASHQLSRICPLLFSWVAPLSPGQQDPSLKPVPPGQRALSRQELAERIVADALPVRFQVQMHKVIWAPDQRGV